MKIYLLNASTQYGEEIDNTFGVFLTQQDVINFIENNATEEDSYGKFISFPKSYVEYNKQQWNYVPGKEDKIEHIRYYLDEIYVIEKEIGLNTVVYKNPYPSYLESIKK